MTLHRLLLVGCTLTSSGAACFDGAEDGPCPALPALTEEERALQGRPNVYEEFLAERPMKSRADLDKEASVEDAYGEIPSGASAKLWFESVECAGGVCVVLLLYEQPRPSAGEQWVLDAIATASAFLMGEEPCGIHFPGRLRLRERSCGVFEQTLFLDCRAPS